MSARPARKVVLAADKFKGSLSASGVVGFVAGDLRRVDPDLEIPPVTVADGSDGTVDAMLPAGYERRVVRVPEPLGAPVDAAFALREGRR